jgi:transcriptional regulator with XRE-family HTH domain
MGAKTSPEKGYSINTLTRMMGVNRRTLVARLEGVTPVKTGHEGKLYRLSDALQGFISQPLRGQEAEALADVRARKLEAETGLAELKLQKERGEVVPHADALSDLTDVIRSLHQQLTQAMPQRLAPALSRVKSPARAAELLREELERVFAELRKEHAARLAEWDEAEAGEGDEAGGVGEAGDEE